MGGARHRRPWRRPRLIGGEHAAAPQPKTGGWHWTEWLCEFLGTFCLLFPGIAAVALLERPLAAGRKAIGSDAATSPTLSVYLVAPLAAGFAAAGLFRLLPRRRTLTAKLFHDARYPSAQRTHLPARPHPTHVPT